MAGGKQWHTPSKPLAGGMQGHAPFKHVVRGKEGHTPPKMRLGLSNGMLHVRQISPENEGGHIYLNFVTVV